MRKLALLITLFIPVYTLTRQQECAPSLLQKLVTSIKKACYGNQEKKPPISKENPEIKAQKETYIGFLSINGPITSGEELIKVLYKMKKNPAIKALFLRLDSCGGALTSAEIIATELTNFKKEKPIVVFVENYCESAAYLIASAATTIFAGQFSMIGSIGVLYEIGYDKKVKTTCIAGGRFKRPTIDENYNIIDDEFIQHTQELINQEYEVMCTLLAQNRNLGIDFIKNLEGRIYASKDALELGLIDAIGSLSDAYIKIEELMKSNGNEINGPLVFVDAQGQEIFRL